MLLLLPRYQQPDHVVPLNSPKLRFQRQSASMSASVVWKVVAKIPFEPRDLQENLKAKPRRQVDKQKDVQIVETTSEHYSKVNLNV